MTKYAYKFLAITCVFIFFSGVTQLKAQYQYSIDIGVQKSRRVSFKYFIGSAKKEFIEAREWRKNKKIEKKSSKRIRKHTYKIQKSEVRKRMKKSKKTAERHNKGKVPLLIKLKRLING
ncbi:MAG: hypothetical protein PF517_09770 [Salinivirgaceae bacterium]|jgi:hypothetical protein|nr:hypothetical protein [Salinivirgaceae bacterium]